MCTGRSAPPKCPYRDFNSHVRHSPPDQARYAWAFRRRRSRRPPTAPSAGRVEYLPRRRHALADGAGDRRHAPRRDRQAPKRRSPRRDHARSQPVERRGGGAPRLPRRRRQPRLPRRPVAERCRASLFGRLHNVAEARRAIEIARATFPRLSFDLIYARPGQTPEGLARRTRRGADARRRSPLALSAHHRRRHALRRALSGGQAEAARRRRCRRLFMRSPRRSATGPEFPPTRSPTMPAREPSAATTSSTGATVKYAGDRPGRPRAPEAS